MYARLRCGGNLPQCLAFGTGGPPMVRNMRAVLKKASWGTQRIFKGPQNSRLHRLWTASCPPDASSVRETASRSEVIRLKRGCIPWKCLRIHPRFS